MPKGQYKNPTEYYKTRAKLPQRKRIVKKYQQSKKGKTAKKKTSRKQLLKRYGLTDESYNKMLEEQGGRCYLCKNSQLGRNLSIDHSHKTGKVRKLLCVNCNMMVGYYERYLNNPDFLNKIKVYVEFFEKVN